MATSTDPLVVCRIIGDVVDMFVPSITMNVYYGPKHVTNGCTIKPSMAINPPRVTITGHSHELYTLVMTDPDAPSPSEPSMREWVHWIVTDIPGDSNPTHGNEILPYMAPRPPVGIHRCILLLFQQKGPLELVEQPMSRANFSTRAFSHQLDLGMPVATVYFNAQKEPMNRKH
ncbi:protein MOTHER of FT and TFL1-like [Actinidia eriantha]|uniref:protein MOTHER of FT and TFL1-like n=1 Tax=Actinidia eriantha TaxID=165200 RepID=UPI002584E97B|nr:protein MOTHER of FT and TFL1-like [Actinidia eriantha]